MSAWRHGDHRPDRGRRRVVRRVAVVALATLAGTGLLVPAAGTASAFMPTLPRQLDPDELIRDWEAEGQSDPSDYCLNDPSGMEERKLVCAPTGNFHLPELDQDFVETP